MEMAKERINSGHDEYRYFLLTYLLPLIGISYNNNLKKIDASDSRYSPGSSFIRQENDLVVFSTHDTDVFQIECRGRLAEDSIKMARNIIPAFFAVSKYRMSNSFRSIHMDYPSDVIWEENLKFAVQKGICDWCAGGTSASFYRLLQILEEWSVKTYEGKKVTFGFVYDPHAKSTFPEDEYGDWFKFLEDDYSATLTDCIHSSIRLDASCSFVEYLSITDKDKVESYTLSNQLPYRFARVIQKYVTGSCVGVFLLSNGDIIISKDQSVRLIKRNLKWLNLGFEAFSNALNAKIKKGVSMSEELQKQIYASTLDVSLAHSGGIIAVVKDISELTNPQSGQAPILNSCDNLRDPRTLLEIDNEMKDAPYGKKVSSKERRKRLLKRKAIIGLVRDSDFSDLDRKLRTELISMDGACILNLSGNVCAIGAIIQNESGSSGGGRSSAAKKLSKYGFAVKISTDGYIELFVDGDAVYAIK